MIFYFSATGNSGHVADSIAQRTGDELVDMAECLKEGRSEFHADEGENVGIVAPTYDWILPSVVNDFLSRLTLIADGENYVFFVATYGTLTGAVGRMVRDLMRSHGYAVNGLFSVKMPDTWTPVFDLSDKDKVASTNVAADEEIEEVSLRVAQRREGDFMRGKMPYLTTLCTKGKYERVRRTSHLRVTDGCIGCGLCAKRCPVGAIEMRGGKPVWVKERCAMCLGCLHRCPRFAIQYDKRTARHGQYVHPEFRR